MPVLKDQELVFEMGKKKMMCEDVRFDDQGLVDEWCSEDSTERERK